MNAPRVSKPQLQTIAYQIAHGKQPRGRGRWAFFFDGGDEPWFPPGTMHFSAARKAAFAEAIKRGASRVKVGS